MKRNNYISILKCSIFAAIAAMVVVSCEDTDPITPSKINPIAKQLKDPVVNYDENLPKLHQTTWTCVTFGEYPQAEVISDNNFTSVADYGVKDGDLIVDKTLYSKLQSATWTNDETKINNSRYCRIKAVPTDDHGHYYSTDKDAWHYFKYEPVKWRVVSLSNDDAILLADKAMDCHVFNDTNEPTTWSNSSLRAWMNSEMYDMMFSDEEEEYIKYNYIINDDNCDYGTDCGQDTQDHMYILSSDEIYSSSTAKYYGFYDGTDIDDPARRFKPTMYAMCRGAWYSMADTYRGNTFWFMRTSGYNPESVSYVCEFGFTYSRGDLVTTSDAGIVPVIRVSLYAPQLALAASVSSDDIMQESSSEGGDRPEIPIDKDSYKGLNCPSITLDESLPYGHVTTWDCIEFGNYPQSKNADGTFETEPVRWRVLNISGTTALLLADKVLDCHQYESSTSVAQTDWESSGLRAWMNSDMYNTMFSDKEKSAIVESSVSNVKNYYFETPCGNDTKDKMFILSEQEIFASSLAQDYGFSEDDGISDPARRFAPTEYAVSRGVWTSSDDEVLGDAFWMLRSNGYSQQNMVYACEYGFLYNRGINVRCSDIGVLPAIRVDLSKADYKLSGTVCSDDIIKE